MSLKHDIEEYPDMWSKEIVAALENYKNGEINSKRKLRKFVNREISEHYYNVLIERHAFEHRINKAKKERERSQRRKDVLFSILSFIILFGSMATTLGEIVVRYGKGIAFIYFFLWICAIDYVVEKDKKSKQIEKLERENEYLKESLKIYRKE